MPPKIPSGSGGGGVFCEETFSHWADFRIDIPGRGVNVVLVPVYIMTCAQYREQSSNPGLLECLNCTISTHGSPTFAPTKLAAAINRDLNNSLNNDQLLLLSMDSQLTDELNNIHDSQGNSIDVKASKFIIDAVLTGLADGSITQEKALFLNSYFDYDLTDPAVFHLFTTYFYAKAAWLKFENPGKYLYNPNGSATDSNNINEALLILDVWGEAFHWTLQVAGLIPGLGEPFDLLDAGIYLLEGDGVNATISAASTIPVLGIISSGKRMGWKVVAAASDLHSKKVHKWVVDFEGKITFGYSGDLAKNFPPYNTAIEQAHHIIPWEKAVREHDVIQGVAKDGFHLNEKFNGIIVKKAQNQPNHPIYSAEVRQKLDYIKNNVAREDWYDEVNALIDRIRGAIGNAGPDVHLDDINFR